jgi:hypothetical protein
MIVSIGILFTAPCYLLPYVNKLRISNRRIYHGVEEEDTEDTEGKRGRVKRGRGVLGRLS